MPVNTAFGAGADQATVFASVPSSVRPYRYRQVLPVIPGAEHIGALLQVASPTARGMHASTTHSAGGPQPPLASPSTSDERATRCGCRREPQSCRYESCTTPPQHQDASAKKRETAHGLDKGQTVIGIQIIIVKHRHLRVSCRCPQAPAPVREQERLCPTVVFLPPQVSSRVELYRSQPSGCFVLRETEPVFADMRSYPGVRELQHSEVPKPHAHIKPTGEHRPYPLLRHALRFLDQHMHLVSAVGRVARPSPSVSAAVPQQRG
jgi:hypothetical protein